MMSEAINYVYIPEHCRESVRNYIERGVPLGGFLAAVFSNDFIEAVGRADDVNREHLHSYAMFLHNEAPLIPVPSYGSPAAYRGWLEIGGLAGVLAGRRPEGQS